MFRWKDDLPYETLRPFLVKIIPLIKRYLEDENIEILEESSKSDQINKKKTLEIIPETNEQRIRKKILLFLGKTPSDLHYLLKPSEDEMIEIATVWDMERKLDYDIPFTGSIILIFS